MKMRIPSAYPRAKALALLCWLFGIIAGCVYALALVLAWPLLADIAFILVGLCILGFLVTASWYIVECVKGTVTPWRRRTSP